MDPFGLITQTWFQESFETTGPDGYVNFSVYPGRRFRSPELERVHTLSSPCYNPYSGPSRNSVYLDLIDTNQISSKRNPDYLVRSSNVQVLDPSFTHLLSIRRVCKILSRRTFSVSLFKSSSPFQPILYLRLHFKKQIGLMKENVTI